MRGLLFVLVLLLAGCSSEPASFADRFARIEEGMTVAEVDELLGVAGDEMPNLHGDNRGLFLYDVDGQKFSVAFVDGLCVGARELPQ